MDLPAITGNRLAVIAGSSFDAEALEPWAPHDETVETELGPIAVIDIGEAVVVRRHHTTGEFTPAHLVDHRRTLAGIVAIGCNRVLALGSVGSLGGWPVGTVIAPFDFFAPWVNPSFFADIRAHSVPGFDERWRDRVIATWEAATETPLVDGGVYAQTLGPRFETPAEIRMLAQHADVVGMTIASESILAREAGLAYMAICVIDNMGNGLSDAPLTVDEFHAGVARNQARLLDDLRLVLPGLTHPPA